MITIFISWSGVRSKAIADALKDWLPDVLHSSQVWVSSHDIDAGVRWSQELAKILSHSNIGILCLTPENQKAPWLLFEAGALSKSVEDSRVIPFLLGLSPSEVESPLAQFQSVPATEEGVRKLVLAIATAGGGIVDGGRLDRLFSKFWPDLLAHIERARSLPVSGSHVVIRPDREVLSEILQLVRNLERYTGYIDSSADLDLTVDLFELTGKRKQKYINLSARQPVSDFLDAVFFSLRESGAPIFAYTYGKEWLLQNERTGEIYDNIGREYCESKGKTREETPVWKLGLRAGDRLSVILPTGSSLGAEIARTDE